MLSAINFTIPYSIASVQDSSNTADIFPGTPFPLLFEIEVSSCTGNNTNCNNVRLNFNLNTILQVNLMTCGLEDSGTSILKNELENSEDGAGQIGFQLSNDGTNEMQYGKSNYYSFQHPHEGSNQIPLFIRPRTYGNNVSSGQIMSRVKIVVMYN